MPRETRPGRADEALGTGHPTKNVLFSLRVVLVQGWGEDVAHWVGEVPNLKMNEELK